MIPFLMVVGGILAGLLVVVLCLASLKPAQFRVTRSITIMAPPATVYPFLVDFHQWNQWSPWDKLDPGMQRTYEGAATGVGTVYAWDGNNKVGQGRMEILEADAPSRVKIQLDFLRPFRCQNFAEFLLEPRASATSVTWSMSGENQFMGKVMQVFISMDSMVGKDFETGLANLKSAAETKLNPPRT